MTHHHDVVATGGALTIQTFTMKMPCWTNIVGSLFKLFLSAYKCIERDCGMHHG